jgi:hypothetical protein
MDWSIESEILRLAKSSDLNAALRRYGFLAEDVSLSGIRQLDDWHRGGAETYILSFVIVDDHGGEAMFLAKALVAATLGTPPERQLEHWTARRNKLESVGCPVSRWYLWGNALIIEEYLPDSLDELLTKNGHQPELWQTLLSICTSVAQAGYRPISVIPNIRGKHGRLRWVDFGEDLGGRTPDVSSLKSTISILAAEYGKLTGYSDVATMPPVDGSEQHKH